MVCSLKEPLRTTSLLGSFDISSSPVIPMPTKPMQKLSCRKASKSAGCPTDKAIFAATSTGVAGVETGQSDELHGGDIKRWTIDIPTLSLAADEYFISIRASFV